MAINDHFRGPGMFVGPVGAKSEGMTIGRERFREEIVIDRKQNTNAVDNFRKSWGRFYNHFRPIHHPAAISTTPAAAATMPCLA